MSLLLSVVIDAGQLERAVADLAVATFFESDRPLRGEAGRADWRLCGLLSELVAGPHLRGRAGEAALVHTGGKLRAPRLVLLGLGAPAGFSALDAKAAARDAVHRALALRATTVALPLPGHWTGMLPITPTAAAVLRGAATALTEANAILAKRPGTRHHFDRRLLQNLTCDVRIVMTWDSDNSDMDLHVIEPTGEDCNYSYNLTQVGGKLSKDFTNGYGPEDYMIHRAVPGVYKIQTNYFGSQEQKLTGGTTVQATVITNFGRPSEKRQHITLRLTQNKETVTLGEVKL